MTLDENDEPLRELCFDYRNCTSQSAEEHFQRIVAWVRGIEAERDSAMKYGHKHRLEAALAKSAPPEVGEIDYTNAPRDNYESLDERISYADGWNACLQKIRGPQSSGS